MTKIIPPTYSSYYDYNKYEMKRSYDITPSAKVYVCGELVRDSNTMSAPRTSFSTEMHLAYTIEGWVLHREDGPAYIERMYSHELLYFHFNGFNYTIEDMPVSDELKCILVLKYGHTHLIDSDANDYRMYRENNSIDIE